jgi:hypothetical protein
MKYLLKTLMFTCGTNLIGSLGLYAQVEEDQPQRIERLDQPKAVPPPGSDPSDLESQAEDDLRRKQQQRKERDQSLLPPEPPYSLQRAKNLKKEALTPHDRSFMFELSFHLTTAAVRGDRTRYTSDPAVHFNLFYRHDAKNRSDKTGPWFGFRLAPFSGSGFHKQKFGSYGLTYFGPMVGVGKIGLIQTKENGPVRSDKNEDINIPSTSGWLIATGVAAVSKMGRSTEEDPPKDSDFSSQGVAIDGSGIWLEARYIQILYGALGYNAILGIQTGKNKEFLYAGFGVSGWD